MVSCARLRTRRCPLATCRQRPLSSRYGIAAMVIRATFHEAVVAAERTDRLTLILGPHENHGAVQLAWDPQYLLHYPVLDRS